MKQQWIENSTALQDALKSLAEYEAQKKAIEDKITDINAKQKPKPAEQAPEPTDDSGTEDYA